MTQASEENILRAVLILGILALILWGLQGCSETIAISKCLMHHRGCGQ